MNKTKLSLDISKLSFEATDARTNWMPFKGACAFTNRPSNYTPSGGDKPVQFPDSDMKIALPTFENMGVNCKCNDPKSSKSFDGHNSDFKVGVVKTAELIDNEVIIEGGLWDHDFSELCAKVKDNKDSLGFSIEVLMHLEDKGDFYEATDIEFTGVCLMWADKAAFAKTYMFAQKINNGKGGISMEKQELQAMLLEFSNGINKAINDNIEGVKAEFSAQIEGVSKVVTDFQAGLVAEKEALALAAIEEAKDAEEKAKLALAAKEILDAEVAEKAKLALEAKVKAEADAVAQRQTLSFGSVQRKFEGDNDAEKAIMANKDMDAGEQFRALIALKLEQAK